PMRHLEWLAAAIDELLRDAGVGPDGVEAVAVGKGPGGFTGLRIGIATAAAWARAGHAPVLGVPTLEVLAASTSTSGLVLAVLDAHRGEVAAALYRLGQEPEPLCLVPPVVAAPQAVVAEMCPALERERALHQPLVVAGDGLARYAGTLRAALGGAGVRHVVERPDAYPSAAAAGRLARPRLLRGARDAPAELLPVYGRRPVVRLWQESPVPPGTEE
ncbi:MAG TPA: tRNA (adenosine(37)-N6)-threonylcarbamoyltransferase complex dimerization subunit type 1 TsaB, partial [bacterium]|nr:tRNA (adenosine(37)-N6)-threonylcarbamoyltransferase complex dimerization subunit type 1 TsaB [bacterium]